VIMSDETRRILDLLAQQKITVDEADQLLRAVTRATAADDAPSASGTATEPARPRYFRINIHKTGREGRLDKDVNLRVPIAILRSGLRLGTIIPGLNNRMQARLRERGIEIDLAKIDASTIESLLKDLGQLNIDVNEGEEQVRITCE